MSNHIKKIDPDDELQEVFKDPRAKKVFKKYQMDCTECGGFAREKLRHAAVNHGLDVEALIREICAEK